MLGGATGAVWAYFNNDWEGFAPANARSLRRLLGMPGPGEAEVPAPSP